MSIEVAIALLIGIAIGCVIMSVVQFRERNHQFIGYIRIDTSDPDGPYPFLESRIPMDALMKRKYVIVRIIPENYISQD